MTDERLRIQIDASAAATLPDGLRMALVDPQDQGATREWVRAVSRGFHEADPTDEHVAEIQADVGDRRAVAVLDDSLAEPAFPVATAAGWALRLTVPGGTAEAWAIAGVSVAATHRRRGIARALLEDELRTAIAAGVPLAALTVSETTIYGRFGFGPAAWFAHLVVETRRARWVGPVPSGRVQFVSRERMLSDAPAILDRTVPASPGEIAAHGLLLTSRFGRRSEPDEVRARRIVRYDDAQGVPQGFAVYRLRQHGEDFARKTLELLHLTAATDDAYAALWRHVLEVDLVVEVHAFLRPVEEPLPWLVADQRGIRTRSGEHLWLRVLDPVAALQARRYAGAGRVALEVSDALGHAAGTVLVEADEDGVAAVARVDAPPAGVPVLALDVTALSSLYLGGVAAATLRRAARVTERTEGAAAAVDRLFRSAVVPWLSIWF